MLPDEKENILLDINIHIIFESLYQRILYMEMIQNTTWRVLILLLIISEIYTRIKLLNALSKGNFVSIQEGTRAIDMSLDDDIKALLHKYMAQVWGDINDFVL